MFDRTVTFESPTGALLAVHQTDAKAPERGIVLIQHGLAEHGARYARFAGDLAARGFHVYAHDHRGHGSTTAIDAPLRRFARTNGAAKVLADAHAVIDRARAEHHDLPLVVFGHSLGAHIALNLAVKYDVNLAGVAAWNADTAFGLKGRLAVRALKVERALKGSDVASDLFARATFVPWSRSIVDRRTDADWLSHDPSVAGAYLDDPLCGWTPTVSMALDVLDLVARLNERDALGRIATNLPVHVLCGGADAATRRGAAAHETAGALRHAGCRDVTAVVIEAARHETLNEIEPIRQQALNRLDAWLDRIASPRA